MVHLQLYLPCSDNNLLKFNSEKVFGLPNLAKTPVFCVSKILKAIVIVKYKNFIFVIF